jgi:LysM repeat protein
MSIFVSKFKLLFMGEWGRFSGAAHGKGPSSGPKAASESRGAGIFTPLLAAFALAAVLSGCGGVSEDELNKIKEENVSLAAELEREKRKAEILNQALAAAYKERDRLVEALEAPLEIPQEEAEANPPVAPRIYRVKTGDTLSRIAYSHQTTTGVLVTLNPYLRTRRDLMVWEGDKILLPPLPD